MAIVNNQIRHPRDAIGRPVFIGCLARFLRPPGLLTGEIPRNSKIFL